MIHLERLGRVVWLQLEAGPVNVLDIATLEALSLELAGLAEDPELAAVLVSGKGRCFSAGASVDEHGAEHVEQMLGALRDACFALADLPVPSVALVHGTCLGGALELASFCDMVIADPGASFGQPEIRLAFFPPLACYRLARLAGHQNAAWLALTGQTVDADRALAMGLVQELMPQNNWERIVKRFQRLSTPVLRLTKQALRTGKGERDVAVPRLEEMFLRELMVLEDPSEGIASFAEKRRPEWSHR